MQRHKSHTQFVRMVTGARCRTEDTILWQGLALMQRSPLQFVRMVTGARCRTEELSPVAGAGAHAASTPSIHQDGNGGPLPH
jgi:hypothetical protein